MDLDSLPRPFLVLAPMYEVTDTVFRQVIYDCAPPDLYFTEFVNVDGLESAGREKLLPKLAIGPYEGLSRSSHLDGVQGSNEKRANSTNDTLRESRKQLTQQSAKSTSRVAGSASKQAGVVRRSVPIIAQIWGKHPKNYYKTTKDLIEMGFDGVDINMGCPDKAILKNGCCCALVDNRELAGEIIGAVREAAGEGFPVSVKTRLGLKEVDLGWLQFLLEQKLNMLTIHGRTARQMSKVPADWELIDQIREMRDKTSPSTLVVGNGDMLTRTQAEEYAKKYKLDGVMIGRGVFQDPFVFSDPPAGGSPWDSYTPQQKIELYKKHIELFRSTYKNGGPPIKTLNKFCKIYINGFEGAKEMREKLMQAKTLDELLAAVDKLV